MKNQQPLFIFGNPRSGTTLLQRIINSSDQATIWGESGLLISHIAQSYMISYRTQGHLYKHCYSINKKGLGVRKATKLLRNHTQWSGVTNWMNATDLTRSYRVFIESMLKPPGVRSKYWGFKEIMTEGNILGFLIDLYPNAKFVFTQRDPVSVIKSQRVTFRQGKDVQDMLNLFKSKSNNMIAFARKYPKNCHIVGIEDLTKNPNIELSKLYKFLDIKLTTKPLEVLNSKQGRTYNIGWPPKDTVPDLTKEEIQLIIDETKTIVEDYELLKKTKCLRILNTEYSAKYSNIKAIHSKKPSFTYIPIAKVACSSLKTTLKKIKGLEKLREDSHNFDMFKPIKKIRKKHTIVAFVRNPWDRLVSCYIAKLKESNLLYDGVRENLKARGLYHDNMTFEEFVIAVSKIPDEYADNHFRSQYTFLYTKDNKLAPNYIGRFENLAKDYRIIARRIGLKKELPHINENKHPPFQTFYTETTKKIVAERFKEDIELFGYKFE